MKEIEENNELQWALDHSLNTDCYPDVFDKNIGMDFHLNDHPNCYPQIASYSYNEERTVHIEITSYRGMCFDAIHYYATIKADGVKLCEDIEENGKKSTIIHGGYLGEEYNNLPREKRGIWTSRYEIEGEITLTQEEIYKDPKRWEYYDVGDKTNAFESKSELIETAKKVAKIRFPEWNVEIEDNS